MRISVRAVSLMLVAATMLVGCGDPSGDDTDREHQSDAYVPVLTIEDGGESGPDGFVTLIYASRVLEHHGIPRQAGGSLGYSISVRPDDVQHAEALLRGQSGLRGFVRWVRGGDKDAEPTLERRTAYVSAPYGEALAKYAAETIEGRILRDRKIEQMAASESLSTIEAIAWTERPFVTARLAPTTAISAIVEYKPGRRSRGREPRLERTRVALMPE